MATSYSWLPPAYWPSSVLELANLYVSCARDGGGGTQMAPTFDDAVWLHHLFDAVEESSRDGKRVQVG